MKWRKLSRGGGGARQKFVYVDPPLQVTARAGVDGVRPRMCIMHATEYVKISPAQF